MDVLLDGFHKLHVFLGGVGVIHTQVAQAAKLLGSAEVNDQGLAVADVQVAVGLRREPGVNGFAGEPAPFGNIFFNKGVNEILAFRNLSHLESFLSFGGILIMRYYNPLPRQMQPKTFFAAAFWTKV